MIRRYDAVLFDLLTGLLDSWTLWNAVAGSEQEMGADIDRNRAQIVQLTKQLLAIWRDCVPGLVVAKPAVDGREFTRGFRQVHVDMNRALRPRERRNQHQAEQGTIAKASQLGEAHPGRSYLVHDKQATPFPAEAAVACI